jgi:uncharacterized protein YggE
MRTRTIGLVALAALLVSGLTGCGTRVVTVPAGTGDEATPLGTVTMRGSGTASAAPDQAQMSFGIETEDADAREALDEASRVAEDIVDAVKDQGVDSDDIQTTDVSIYPRMDYDRDGPPRIEGYRASIRVSVTVTSIEDTGDVIAAATDAGANSMSGPSFTLSEDNPERTQAIADAVEDARMRAEAAAEAAGKRLGDVLSVAEEGVTAPPIQYRFDSAVAAEEAIAPPIEPGQLDLTASVKVVFELK